jgi:hypothetical protein
VGVSETRVYTKVCNSCSRRIRMQKLPSGNWMPLNLDGTDHNCWHPPASAVWKRVRPQRPAPPPRPSLPRPSTGRIRATAEQIFTKVQSPLVQQHAFCVRAVIHWGPNHLKCLAAIRTLDEPSEGALCDPRHAVFFGRTDSLHDIERKLEGWFDSHPNGME